MLPSCQVLHAAASFLASAPCSSSSAISTPCCCSRHGFCQQGGDSRHCQSKRKVFGCVGAGDLHRRQFCQPKQSKRKAFGCVAAAGNAPRGTKSSFSCKASQEIRAEGGRELVELPLFPLPLVLFPGAILPLQIFEFRYRIMMHTLLQTDLRFGVVFTDRSTGLAEVGCVGEVIKHERLVDDRFFLICKGQERFRVVNLVRTAPYLVAEVEWLEDKPSNGQDDLDTLANEVEAYMRDVIRLSNRMNKKPEKETPEDLRKNLFPTPFSFWVGSTFEGAPMEQQALLELEDTALRLKREKETLRNTLNYLTAASAVKDVFSSSSD